VIPARTPGAILAEVHRRARRYRRRQAITAAAVVGGVLLVALLGVRIVGGGGDGNDETTTGGTVAPPELNVEVIESADTGLPGGFVPKNVSAGPEGFVLIGDAPGGGEPVWRSDDGRAWTPAPGDTFADTSAASLAATPNRYLIGVTDAAGGSPRFLWSDDGQTWELASQPGVGEDLVSLRSAGHRFYRASGGGLTTSIDGTGWEATRTDTGQTLPAGTFIDTVDTTWVALLAGGDGVIAAAWQSPDGLTFAPVAGPGMRPAGIVGGKDQLLLAATAPGSACTPGTAATTSTAATTGTATTTAPAVCENSVAFARFDVEAGQTQATPEALFATEDATVPLARMGDGWIALQRSPAGIVVWASSDGLTWAQASDTVLGVAPGGPVVVAAGSDGTVVVSDSAGNDRPPGVAVVTER